MDQPVVMQWDGEAFHPVDARQQALADELFVVGEKHALVEYKERDWNSHRHYFAALKDMWANLPEALAPRFKTPEHLRKKALVACGFADSAEIVCESNAQALALAAWAESADEYAIVTVKGNAVVRWTAKSQSQKAMGRQDFQHSKWRVLNFVADLLRLPPEDSHRLLDEE